MGGSEGAMGELTLGAGGDAPRTWLEQHAAPVARSGHTLTAVRLHVNAGEGGGGGGGGEGGEVGGEGEAGAGAEVLLLFGGEAAARVEHRVAEEFEARYPATPLQPPATVCAVACNRMCDRPQPHVRQPATACTQADTART